MSDEQQRSEQATCRPACPACGGKTEKTVLTVLTPQQSQLPHGKPGHTVLREALLVADHNAYHIGQLVVVRRALGAWPDD